MKNMYSIMPNLQTLDHSVMLRFCPFTSGSFNTLWIQVSHESTSTYDVTAIKQHTAKPYACLTQLVASQH